ncbi:metal ABC transporter ATP-binding protein [Cellulosilyticum sp. I15G10I2]|uniref:metal ABC transporter ATP-binding protein n=1 Tax=Cellulosilyticum sp. I15G10I2 TaxID=1892843 RepID=UPI00085C45F1|nr:metal ABC transporter ATP-binding protein [Cellulosilyticum sp. I15G10I2]
MYENCKNLNLSQCTGHGLCCTKVQHMSVKRGGHYILKDVDLHIHCGELTAIIGSNGAGKSTFLKALLGEIPHGGKVTYLGAKESKAKQPIIGYVPQKLDFDLSAPMSVLDIFAASCSNFPIWLGSSNKIRERVIRNLKRVQAEHLIDRKLGVLSGGELQRVLLALALDPIPNILLLDEPVSGIDQNGLKLFYEMVAKLRKAYDLSIILVSHDLHLVAEYADRVAFLNKGVIEKCGTPKEVFGSEEVRLLFHIDFYQETIRENNI